MSPHDEQRLVKDLICVLARAVIDSREPDKWHQEAERLLAKALEMGQLVHAKDLYSKLNETRQRHLFNLPTIIYRGEL